MSTKIYIIKGNFDAGETNQMLDTYLIDNLSNLTWSVETPATPMPLPEDSHTENILVKMEGNTAKMDISWTLTEGTQFGKLNRTTRAFQPGGSKTVFEHVDEFKERFVPISLGDGYTVLITDESDEKIFKDSGTINNMSFSVSGSSPVIWNVNMSFYVGNVVAALEEEIPPAPTEVKFQRVSDTSFSYTFTAYDGYASEPSGDAAITGHVVQIKDGNKPWSTNYVRDTTNAGSQGQTPVNFTGLTANASYKMRLAQTNANSETAVRYYYANATIVGGTNRILEL